MEKWRDNQQLIKTLVIMCESAVDRVAENRENLNVNHNAK